MPAWITSLLRDEVTVPIASAASRMITSRPACASRRATARPITPAPITTHSTLSIRAFRSQLWAMRFNVRFVRLAPDQGQSRARIFALLEDDLAEEPVEFVSERFPDRLAVREALNLSLIHISEPTRL